MPPTKGTPQEADTNATHLEPASKSQERTAEQENEPEDNVALASDTADNERVDPAGDCSADEWICIEQPM